MFSNELCHRSAATTTKQVLTRVQFRRFLQRNELDAPAMVRFIDHCMDVITTVPGVMDAVDYFALLAMLLKEVKPNRLHCTSRSVGPAQVAKACPPPPSMVQLPTCCTTWMGTAASAAGTCSSSCEWASTGCSRTISASCASWSTTRPTRRSTRNAYVRS